MAWPKPRNAHKISADRAGSVGQWPSEVLADYLALAAVVRGNVMGWQQHALLDAVQWFWSRAIS